MNSPKVLIVDDEADIRQLLEITLSRMGLTAVTAENLEDARHLIKHHHFDLCLTDMRLPDGRGIDLVYELQNRATNLPIAVITAYSNTQDAIESLKAGAFDFVTKPVDIPTLRRLISVALKTNETPSEPLRNSVYGISGETASVGRLRELVTKLARSQAPVFICGESGTGKERVAQMIHFLGPRRDRPFVPVNCAAVPEELMESEFFGHTKGSFTGAHAGTEGLFKSANGGTLFLDEVGDLPLSMQVKLLRAIQERKIRSIGSITETPVDVRIISATHKNLEDLVTSGAFRQDLYYRLNVIDVQVPPLRERRQDIPLIAQEILQGVERYDGKQAQLSQDALSALCAYDFPGNIRELENILQRASALSDNALIEVGDLKLAPPQTAAKKESTSPLNIDESLAETERQRIQDALVQAKFNQTKAAKILGISFRSLRYRVDKLGIDKK